MRVVYACRSATLRDRAAVVSRQCSLHAAMPWTSTKPGSAQASHKPVAPPMCTLTNPVVQVGRHKGRLQRGTVQRQEAARLSGGPLRQLHITHRPAALPRAQRQAPHVAQEVVPTGAGCGYICAVWRGKERRVWGTLAGRPGALLEQEPASASQQEELGDQLLHIRRVAAGHSLGGWAEEQVGRVFPPHPAQLPCCWLYATWQHISLASHNAAIASRRPTSLPRPSPPRPPARCRRGGRASRSARSAGAACGLAPHAPARTW